MYMFDVAAIICVIMMPCLFCSATANPVDAVDLPGSSDTIALSVTPPAETFELIIRRGNSSKIYEIPDDRTGLGRVIGRDLMYATKAGSSNYWIITRLGVALGGAVLLDSHLDKIVEKYTGQNFSVSPQGDYIVWNTYGNPIVILCNGAIAFFDRGQLTSRDVQRVSPDDHELYALLKGKVDRSKCTTILEPIKWLSPSEFCFVLGETKREPSEDCQMMDAETSYTVRINISDAGENELLFNATVQPGSADYESVPQTERPRVRYGLGVTKDEVLSGTVVQRVKLLPITSE